MQKITSTLVRVVGLLAFLASTTRLAFAQDFQRIDLFGGYSYVNVDMNGWTSRQSLNGWEASTSINVTKWVAAEGDVSGYYKSIAPGASAHDYSFLGGARINIRPAFFHVLAGVDNLTGNTFGLSGSQTSGAGLFGGGIQQKVSTHFGLRASVDYVLTHHNILGGPGVTQNNFRFSGGLVCSFGRTDR